MYLVNCKVSRGGSKYKKEVYLVDTDNPTTCDSMVAKELNGTTYKVDSMKNVSFDEINETGKGTFYQIRIENDNLEGKTFKSVHLQEENTSENAWESIMNKLEVSQEIIEFKRTEILSIIKQE